MTVKISIINFSVIISTSCRNWLSRSFCQRLLISNDLVCQCQRFMSIIYYTLSIGKMKIKCNRNFSEDTYRYEHKNVYFSVRTMNFAKRRGVHRQEFHKVLWVSPDLSLNECNLPSTVNNLLRGLRDVCVSDIHYNTKAIKCSINVWNVDCFSLLRVALVFKTFTLRLKDFLNEWKH